MKPVFGGFETQLKFIKFGHWWCKPKYFDLTEFTVCNYLRIIKSRVKTKFHWFRKSIIALIFSWSFWVPDSKIVKSQKEKTFLKPSLVSATLPRASWEGYAIMHPLSTLQSNPCNLNYFKSGKEGGGISDQLTTLSF